MSGRLLPIGTFVCHDDQEIWGQGIVTEHTRGYACVAFSDGTTRRFSLTTQDRLVKLDSADVPADAPIRLAVGRAGLAERRRISDGIEDLINRFNAHFPDGFDSAKYREAEDYKVDELRKACAALEAVPACISAEDWDGAVEAMGRATSATNLLHTFEKIRTRKVSHSQRRAVAESLGRLIAARGDEIGHAVEDLGVALQPDGANKWTVTTWLACASHPDDHGCPMVRPTPIHAAAAALKVDLQYKAQPNARTWEKAAEVYKLLGMQVEPRFGRLSMLQLYTLLWYGCGLADANISRHNSP
jgi:hypothetical protein